MCDMMEKVYKSASGQNSAEVHEVLASMEQ